MKGAAHTEWVTGADDLTQNQQITALGNGVLPLQACAALTTGHPAAGAPTSILSATCRAPFG